MESVGRAAVILAVVSAGVFLVGCGGDEAKTVDEGPRYVTTIPPFEMIVRPLVEGRATVEGLVAPGTSPHTYDPTPSDLRATTDATALLFGAEHLDGWAADLPASRRVALIDLVPGSMRLFFDDGGHGKRPTVDPHFWTDPLAVRQLVPVLADTLCAIDSSGCPTYRANADSLATALATLDTRLRAMLAPVRDTPVLLAQPFFRYFLQRYGLHLAGVIEPRPGTEPTPKQLHRIAQAARANGARAILTQQSLSDRAARAVAEASTLPRVDLDPIGGVEGRRTYAELLLDNAQILRDSLASVQIE